MTWNDWGRLTRFLESARIALAREHELWDSLDLDSPDSAKIRTKEGQRTYTVKLAEHRAAVSDSEVLHVAVLVYYYALAESAAADKLDCPEVSKLGGIETWAERLLQQAGGDWKKVLGGKAGIVEVAVVRNIVAHGGNCYTERDVNRLRGAGVTSLPEVGSPVGLDYTVLLEYRARLRSLLRIAQVRDSGSAGDDE